MPGSSPPRVADLFGLGGLSAGILLLELGLTRLLSVTSWYHFAFFAISLAMMGLGASGVFVYAARERLRAVPTPRLFAVSGIAFSTLSLVLMALFLYTPLAVASMTGNLLALVLANLAGIAPFFAGGVYLTVAVSRYSESITKVYAADLLGAAAGCLIFIPTLTLLGGPGPMLVAALLGSATAFLYVPRRLARMAVLGLVGVTFSLVVVQIFQPLIDIQYEKGEEVRPTTFSAWNSYSRVAVYNDPHPDWGLSSTVDAQPAPSITMDIDASASTAILLVDSKQEVEYLRYDVSALGHWLIGEDARTLVIGPGGGRDIWTSLIFGASSVTGVEVNSIIVEDVMRGAFFDASGGVYSEAGVEVVVDDGRNYIARSKESYDLIQASLVDTWAATSSGAFSLSESNLYTVEAFAEYLDHLSEDGVLTVSRWTVGAERLVTLARAAIDELGWDGAARRLFVAASPASEDLGGVATVIVSRRPLTDAQVHHLLQTSDNLGFEVLFAPAVGGFLPTGNQDFIELATAQDLEAVLAGIPTDVSPVTDDKPFFFQTLKIEDLGSLLKTEARASDGIQLTVRLLVLSTALIALFIFLPLRFFSAKRGAVSSQAVRRLPYFGLLGIGFIVMEIGLIQRFVLFLGHPVYALTVVLFTFLLGAGLGSAISRRFQSPAVAARSTLIGVVALGLIYAAILPNLLDAGLGLDRYIRISISIALLLPLAALMGTPLPSGIRTLARHNEELTVAWAWGINGAASVLGSALAILLALTLGFTIVTITASFVYAAALVSHLVAYGPQVDGNGTARLRHLLPSTAPEHSVGQGISQE